MATCTFNNLTPAQAKILASWYENAGEQDADMWFEEAGLETPMTDVGRKGGYREILPNGDVIVHLRPATVCK